MPVVVVGTPAGLARGRLSSVPGCPVPRGGQRAPGSSGSLQPPSGSPRAGSGRSLARPCPELVPSGQRGPGSRAPGGRRGRVCGGLWTQSAAGLAKPRPTSDLACRGPRGRAEGQRRPPRGRRGWAAGRWARRRSPAPGALFLRKVPRPGAARRRSPGQPACSPRLPAGIRRWLSPRWVRALRTPAAPQPPRYFSYCWGWCFGDWQFPWRWEARRRGWGTGGRSHFSDRELSERSERAESPSAPELSQRLGARRLPGAARVLSAPGKVARVMPPRVRIWLVGCRRRLSRRWEAGEGPYWLASGGNFERTNAGL